MFAYVSVCVCTCALLRSRVFSLGIARCDEASAAWQVCKIGRDLGSSSFRAGRRRKKMLRLNFARAPMVKEAGVF